MSKSLQPITGKPVRRNVFRRTMLLTLLLVISVFVGWIVWLGIEEYYDTRALRSYFAERDRREPLWRDKVYGSDLSLEQIKLRERWQDLEKLLYAKPMNWAPMRQGLVNGLAQDPDQPAALMSPEQFEFLKLAHQFWQPILLKLESMEQLPLLDNLIDRKAPYDTMIIQLSRSRVTQHLLNQGYDIETMYQCMMNKPELALPWLLRFQAPSYSQLVTFPALVERWLNLTQPDQASLMRLEVFISNLSHATLADGCMAFANEIRLTEHRFRELQQNELSTTQMKRWGHDTALLGMHSPWDSIWLKWARPHYLNFRVYSVFRRADYLILRLHQLADRIERIPAELPGHRWHNWKQFALENAILVDTPPSQSSWKPGNFTDAMPEGLFLLRGNYVNLQLIALFNLQAQFDTCLASILAERYRLDHGYFPMDWNDLIPRYTSTPLLDAYTGKPLQMRKIEKGLVIYSVGRKGKDEGGANLNHNHYWIYGGKGFDWSKSNIGTRIYLPEFRRSQAITLEKDQREDLLRDTNEFKKELNQDKTTTGQ